MKKPYLGIFTSIKPNIAARRPIGIQTGFFKNLIKIGHKQKVKVFVFSPENINWHTRTIQGVTLAKVGPDSDEQWIEFVFRFPDVIYDRVPNRTSEKELLLKQTKKKLLEIYKERYFNPKFLDKWAVYKALYPSNKLREHLPKTFPLKSWQTLSAMIEEYPEIYFKPQSSSLGKGIIKLKSNKSGYLIQKNDVHNRQKVISQDPKKVAQKIMLALKGRKYLAQQGVMLALYNGRPFDVRALVQKSPQGRWELTGMACRVAGKGRITTHVPNGGSKKSLEVVLREVFDQSIDKPNGFYQRMKEILELAPIHIEQYYKRNFGEMSFDVGIDQRGDIWIFEANAKPARFDEKRIRIKAWHNLMDYVKSLAGNY